MRRSIAWVAGLLLVGLGPVTTAPAHDGPPFPIIVDRRAGPYVISVWTDPDVGIGTFFVILAPPPGMTLPADNRVEVCVRPSSGRLPETCYAGKPQVLRDRVQYDTAVEFDREELWQVRVRVNGADGTGEVVAEVEATPPGFGPWDLLIYGLPFLLLGSLWLLAALRGLHGLRRQRGRDSAEPAGTNSPTDPVNRGSS